MLGIGLSQSVAVVGTHDSEKKAILYLKTTKISFFEVKIVIFIFENAAKFAKINI